MSHSSSSGQSLSSDRLLSHSLARSSSFTQVVSPGNSTCRPWFTLYLSSLSTLFSSGCQTTWFPSNSDQILSMTANKKLRRLRKVLKLMRVMPSTIERTRLPNFDPLALSCKMDSKLLYQNLRTQISILPYHTHTSSINH